MEVKNASNILAKNIPIDCPRTKFEDIGIDPEWIFNAMREYAAQFIELAAEEVVVSNDDPYGSQEEIKESILEIKNQLK